MPIDICKHDPSWEIYFDHIAAQYTSLLGHVLVSVEHVGSTSVPEVRDAAREMVALLRLIIFFTLSARRETYT